MLELRYKPNDLRALHYQISCATLEMIELKEKVTIALLKGEDFLLEAFLKNNSEFQVIQAEEETRGGLVREGINHVRCIYLFYI